MMLKRLLDPNAEVIVTVKKMRGGKYVWIAKDSQTGKHVALGPVGFATAEDAEAHAEKYMKVRGE